MYYAVSVSDTHRGVDKRQQYDRAKLEEYQQTQALIQNAEETIRKDKADLEALQAQLEEEQQAVNLLMQEKETQLSGVRQGISEAEQNAQQYQQEIEAENQLIQEMLAAEAAAKKAAEEQQKQQEVQKNNADVYKRQGEGWLNQLIQALTPENNHTGQ